MEFVNRIEEQERTEALTNYQRYVEMLHQAVDSGDLSAADTQKIAKLAKSIGRNAEAMKADLAVLQRVKDLLPLDGRAAPKRAEFDVSRAALPDFDAETIRMSQARIDERKLIERSLKVQRHDLAELETAETELSHLRYEHWRILGLEAQPATPTDWRPLRLSTEQAKAAAAKHAEIDHGAAAANALNQACAVANQKIADGIAARDRHIEGVNRQNQQHEKSGLPNVIVGNAELNTATR